MNEQVALRHSLADRCPLSRTPARLRLKPWGETDSYCPIVVLSEARDFVIIKKEIVLFNELDYEKWKFSNLYYIIAND